MKRVLVAAVAAVLLLASCSDDDGGALSGGNGGNGGGGGGSSTEEREAVDKVKASLTDDSEDGFAMDDGDAQCVAEKIVASFGVERVNQIDWDDDDTPAFEGNEASQAVAAFDDCLQLNEFLVDLFEAESPISGESRSCLLGQISEAKAASFFEEVFSGDFSDETFAEIDGALQECLTEEEYAAVNS